jgi:hypothetical protein
LKVRFVVSLKLAAVAIAIAAVSTGGPASADTIDQWVVPAVTASPINTWGATTGSGSATQLGMTNNYTYSNGEGPGSVANCDFSNPTSELDWRIRGNSNTKNSGSGEANGWSLSAGTGTQGAEFDASTAGYTGIQVSYDWYVTGQGIATMQPEYSVNTSNSASWVSYGSPVTTPTGGGWTTGLTMNLGSLADNDPSFGIRLVSTYDANPADSSTFGTQYVGASGGVYNNSSGNWGFNNVTISGTPITTPEPSTLALVAIGVFGLVAFRRHRRRS